MQLPFVFFKVRICWIFPSQMIILRREAPRQRIPAMRWRERGHGYESSAGWYSCPRPGYARGQALKAVDALFNGLREALQQGGRIEIRGFGNWTVKATNARPTARNPRTGEVVFVPARRKVAFKPGRVIKEALMQPLDTLQEEECHGTAITR